MEPDRWHQDGEEMVDSSPLRHMAGQVHRDIESVPLIRPENAMNAQLAALDQVQSTAIDLGLKFGPKLLVACLIILAGHLAGRWLGQR